MNPTIITAIIGVFGVITAALINKFKFDINVTPRTPGVEILEPRNEEKISEEGLIIVRR